MSNYTTANGIYAIRHHYVLVGWGGAFVHPTVLTIKMPSWMLFWCMHSIHQLYFGADIFDY